MSFHLAITATEGTYAANFTLPTAPCPNYTISTQTGQTIVPGTVDTGNHCDDCTTPITFPFPVHVYGRSYTAGVVESNGTIQFDGDLNDFANTCLNAEPYGRAFFPYWDDLYTLNSGYGIYTATTGSAPNRVFYIEWRAEYFAGARPTSRPSSTRTTRS